MDLLERLTDDGDGWEGLEALFRPQLQDAPLQPREGVAKFMYGLYHTPEGRAMFEWMMDITLRMPLRSTGQTFEQTALNTATRQGINGVGEAILAAIGHGEKLLSKSQNQNGAGS
ncbi:hypothetical protein [Agrobacterium sp. LMR679]|uniref:hypothetical protein n=1 Tax=Agrobacterium sp. LMR679 TaxID=3014335 RepID=UPI0022AEF0DD|nr:hypothetical protein [Agrobacterium sp. LMR679]MCZ4073549.1 hypothetical protein [Agrobacterium sp. LMR679]MCZ4076241.1 hypothetical protein [Agrobacterium sp. LMR679]MCZ4076309.1 hypothetical protein [Agrobacterium sp. LMR679]